MVTKSNSITTYQEFTELADTLRESAALYYSGEGQKMDDATYDSGIISLREASDENGWSDELLESVAGGQGEGDIEHTMPLLSLDNVFDNEGLEAFFARVAKKAGVKEANIIWAVEPKYDGMALSVQYVNGKLNRIVTRGDGYRGKDVTENAKDASGIPLVLPDGRTDTITVIGEVVMTHEGFDAANIIRVKHNERPFANPRNAVAGSVMSKNRNYKIPMSFFCYSLSSAPEGETHSSTMAWLDSLGFLTASDIVGNLTAVGTAEVLAKITNIEENRANFEMDTDGAVVKANDPEVRKTMGEGSRAPHWAIARKFAPDTRQTSLINIAVEVGRTGNLSFTAQLEPVFVGGTTITFASVHNPSVIAEKGLRLPKTSSSAPQQVIVRRAGEVIPQIVGYANEDNLETTIPFVPPTQCPRCCSDLDTSGLIWRCLRGRECGIEEGLRYAVSRDCLDIDGMGLEIVHSLVESGYLNNVADIFELDMEKLLTVERLGDKNAAKILDGIEKAKMLPLSKIITSLGIKGTGRSMSRNIAKQFGSLKAIRSASSSEMCQVEGIGYVKGPSIVEELIELAPILDKLESLGIGSTGTPPEASQGSSESLNTSSLAGLTVCVTGAMTGPLAGKSRNEVNELIESLGGRASSSVSAKTSFLLTADSESGTGKSKKAADLGVEIVSPEEFGKRYL